MTDTDKERLALLAGLDLSGEAGAQLQADIDRILQVVEVLRTADLPEGTEPLRHPLELGQRTREDQVTETDRRKEVMDQAPDTEANLFLVPRVLD